MRGKRNYQRSCLSFTKLLISAIKILSGWWKFGPVSFYFFKYFSPVHDFCEQMIFVDQFSTLLLGLFLDHRAFASGFKADLSAKMNNPADTNGSIYLTSLISSHFKCKMRI